MTIEPQGLGGFFAVQENIGDLDLILNTASSYSNDTFIQLEANAFEYVVRVPESAKPGSIFEISGEYWTDPSIRHVINPPLTELRIE